MNAIVKNEVDFESDDEFDLFPEGAIRFKRETLFRRMEEKRAAELHEQMALEESKENVETSDGASVVHISDSQLSTSSAVIPAGKHKRTLRVVCSEDENDSDDEEAPEQDQTTPKKKSGPNVLETPSPAKKMRNLNLRENESESEFDEEFDEDEKLEDSQVDPEWTPDSQDNREKPSDWEIPKCAAHDPLDLD